MSPRLKAKQDGTRVGKWRQIIQPGDTATGDKQYRVQLSGDTFYICVDSVRVTSSGDLLGLKQDEVLYAFSAGNWLFCVPVSAIDGSEHVAAWYSLWLDG